MVNSIKINSLKHRFDKKEILKEINLSIEDGEIFGLLGPTGAGKTTILKIITGQLRQSSGEAFVFGRDTRDFSFSDYEQFGMLLDNVGIYDRMNCYDNMRLFTKIYNIKKEKIDEVLGRVGLSEAKKTLGMNLSKGMRQRLALARAIIHQPKILFLDEPTSGLDPSTARGIHKLLKGLQEEGSTIFLTTHNMVEATKLCDHVGLLHNGELLEYGAPEEICHRYNQEKEIEIRLETGKIERIKNCPDSAKRIAMYFSKDEVRAIHSKEPSLETVFIERTGRGFE